MRPSSAYGRSGFSLTPYVEGVTQGPYFSFEQYLKALAADGYEIVRSPFIPRWLTEKVRERGHTPWKALALFIGYARRLLDLVRARQYDGIYISDWFVPFGPGWLNELAPRCFTSSVLDLCDRVYEGHASDHGSVVSRFKRPEFVKRLATAVDEVVVVTRFMREDLLAVGRPITVISSSLNSARYSPWGKGNPYPTRRRLDRKPFHLQISEAAGGVARARPRASRIRHYCHWGSRFHFASLERASFPGRQRTRSARFDSSISGCTHSTTTNWVNGKAGMKAIQYMAMGIPVIATPVGVTPDLVVDGVNGYLATSTEEWTDAIVRLVRDAALRSRLGANGRALAESRYSTSALAPAYSDLFARVFRRG